MNRIIKCFNPFLENHCNALIGLSPVTFYEILNPDLLPNTITKHDINNVLKQ